MTQLLKQIEREREREHQSAAAAREWKRSQEFATTVLEQEAAAKRKEEEAAARERRARDLEAKRREHEAGHLSLVVAYLQPSSSISTA